MLLLVNHLFLYFVTTILSFCIIFPNAESNFLNSNLVTIDKRQTLVLSSVNPNDNTSMAAFQREIRHAHNHNRELEESANMVEMISGRGLSELAQKVANTCVFNHSTPEFKKTVNTSFSYIGENLYLGTNKNKEVKDVVKMWYDEKEDYNYEATSCSGICGHYTQVVWAASKVLGCGVKFCSSVAMPNGGEWNNAYFVVCEYGPGGNVKGKKPYVKGHPCEMCPQDCVDDKLCNKYVSVSKRRTLETRREMLINTFLKKLRNFIQRTEQTTPSTDGQNTEQEMVLK